MTHHQGMSLLSVSNLLSDEAVQRLFHEEPLVQATERLLHERVPPNVLIEQNDLEMLDTLSSGRRPFRRHRGILTTVQSS